MAPRIEQTPTVGSVDGMAEVSAVEREAFARDGVVVLRGAVAPEWLELLARGVDHNHDHPSRWAFGSG